MAMRECHVKTPTHLSQFILQLVVLCHIKVFLDGPLIKVAQELSIFSFWIDIVLVEEGKFCFVFQKKKKCSNKLRVSETYLFCKDIIGKGSHAGSVGDEVCYRLHYVP